MREKQKVDNFSHNLFTLLLCLEALSYNFLFPFFSIKKKALSRPKRDSTAEINSLHMLAILRFIRSSCSSICFLKSVFKEKSGFCGSLHKGDKIEACFWTP